MMKITTRRAARIRDELRLLLRSRHGIRTRYSREEIDRGREDLGFGSAEDALVAYTVFGGDLMPDIADSLGLSGAVDEIGDLIEAISDSATDTAALLVDI